MNFKGFDDWIEIFKGGKQIDSDGIEHDGDALIDKAISTFDPSYHEPPAVIGHPKSDAPAYGWVEKVKKETKNGTNYLFAKFKQVVPEIKFMAKNGMFKKRSASFYKDGRLRHVGFLGAMPPSVKGLKNMAFEDGEGIVFEFGDNTKIGDHRKRKEVKMSVFGEKFKSFMSAMGVDMSKVPDDALPVDIPHDMKGKSFSEADVEAAVEAARRKAAEEERGKVTSEFTEIAKQAVLDARKKDVSDWCERMVKEGRITPAMVKFGLPEMLSAFAEMNDVIEFGETKEKATLYDRFMALWEKEMPKLVNFGEIATKEKDAGGAKNAQGKIEALIDLKMKDNKELTYGAAFAEVQSENRDLTEEYFAEMREEG